MTSPDNLGSLINTAVRAAVKDAMARTRTPTVLSGRVEQLDSDLDVLWVRLDDETIGFDPTESSNYETPGVIPVARDGDAYTGDPARVRFDAASGASAGRTGTPNVIVLPYGAETGKRVVIDGDQGFIALFDETDSLVGLIDVDVWASGQLDPAGARGTFDPQGGIRMHSEGDKLVVILDQNGLTLNDPVTGLATAELHPGRLRLVDPVGVDDIEIVTSSAATLPNPAYRVAAEANPGATLVAPAAPLFTTTPADDIEIMHVAAWDRAVNTPGATMTPPSGATEQVDQVVADADGTMHVSVATRDPATGAGGTFTDSVSTGWDHALGTTVIIKGGGTTSPSYRSSSTVSLKTTNGVTTLTGTAPTGLAAGDVMVVFISLGVSGGNIPLGWTTPPGFVQLGVWPSVSGSGATQSALSTGAWAKLVTAADVAAGSFSTTINLPTGIKVLHGVLVAVQNPFLVPGGVRMLMAGKPVRRKLAETKLLAASSTLCDFQNIPQGYDNLEVVVNGTSTGSGSNTFTTLRFNGDTGNNYFHRSSQDTANLITGFGVDRIFLQRISNAAGSTYAGSIHIYGRAGPNPTMLGKGVWSEALVIHQGELSGAWSPSAAIDRITIAVDGAPANPRFNTNSTAVLYGY